MRAIGLSLLLLFSAATPALADRPAQKGGIELPGDLRLNGKFDLAYERYGYNSDLRDGDNALRNYHHFVFLSRDTREDPFFFTAELVDLTFYEMGGRFELGEHTPWTLTARAGKVLVPFGAEPLFHHSYGGLSGFDQPVLPIVWAQHGASASLRYGGEGWSITNDVYAVQGYALGASDAVLNLQSDFSKSDHVRVGIGDRIGFGWGPFVAWYSAYFNSLGYGRRLFMQAFDVMLYGLADLPVLRDIALSGGILRADISGGGPGQDYYHFADYVQLRWRALDGLYVNLRTGLRTFDNRDGVYFDDERLDVRDASAHNVGVMWKYEGFMTELTHYWNFEKADEVANDFLRLRVGYAF